MIMFNYWRTVIAISAIIFGVTGHIDWWVVSLFVMSAVDVTKEPLVLR